MGGRVAQYLFSVLAGDGVWDPVRDRRGGGAGAQIRASRQQRPILDLICRARLRCDLEMSAVLTARRFCGASQMSVMSAFSRWIGKNEGDDLASIATVQFEIAVQGEDARIGAEFCHPHEAGASQGHRDVVEAGK